MGIVVDGVKIKMVGGSNRVVAVLKYQQQRIFASVLFAPIPVLLHPTLLMRIYSSNIVSGYKLGVYVVMVT